MLAITHGGHPPKVDEGGQGKGAAIAMAPPALAMPPPKKPEEAELLENSDLPKF